jgi:quinol-cytochrome oxidoreductase complex cytochrome b subunit
MSSVLTLPRARVAVLAILTLQLLVLLVSGVLLFFTYRPPLAAAYAELYGNGVGSSVDLARATTAVHRWAAATAVPMAIVAGVLVALGDSGAPRRRVGVLVGAGLVLVTIVGSFTGYLIAWDQLGLWAVTVGEDMRGYLPLFDEDKVRSVFVGGTEVAPGTMVRWLLVHILVVGSVLALLLGLAWRRVGHREGRVAGS